MPAEGKFFANEVVLDDLTPVVDGFFFVGGWSVEEDGEFSGVCGVVYFSGGTVLGL